MPSSTPPIGPRGEGVVDGVVGSGSRVVGDGVGSGSVVVVSVPVLGDGGVVEVSPALGGGAGAVVAVSGREVRFLGGCALGASF